MSYWDEAARTAMEGKVVKSVELDDHREVITLTFEDGKVARGFTKGECCSQSWVEHLTVPAGIEGATVIQAGVSDYVDEDESFDDPERTANTPEDVYLDHVRVYHDFVRTTAGDIVIEYRNSSNGYYGGSLEWRYR